MKNRKILFGIFLALLTIFGINFKLAANQTTHAAGNFVITLNADGGTCSETILTTNDSGTLDELPTPTKAGYLFLRWQVDNEPVTTSTVFSSDTEITAIYNKKSYIYTISQSNDNFTATGQTNVTGSTYTLTASSLNDVISLISSDLATSSDKATVNLGSITLSENLIININKITLSGEVNLNSHQILYTAQETGAELDFNDFSTSNSNQNQVVIQGTKKTTVTLENCKFQADHTNTSQNYSDYAIYFANPLHTIKLVDKISHETQYLYNHESGISASLTSLDVSEQTGGKISITFPYTLDGSLIFSGSENASKLNFIALQDNYTCSVYPYFGGIYLTVQFDINFDTNSGTSNVTSLNSRYKQSTKLNFPDSENLTREHYTLNGFAGVLNFDSNTVSANDLTSSTYYFNKQSLENLLSDNSENKSIYAKIKEYFLTDIPAPAEAEIAADYGFTYYKNNENDINFKAINLMLELNQTPTFKAIWTQTKYTITFVENGGTDVSDATNTHGTPITLPTTTRTGYTFDGWYTTDPNGEDFDENSKLNSTNITINENLTIYAKWTLCSYTLTIHPNTSTAPSTVEKSINFNASISSLSELADNYYQKTGYSLVSWHTSETLNEESIVNFETFLMPDNNVSIYAKWQINQYTINIYNNHKGDNSLYTTLTKNYGESVTELFTTHPDFEGYEFQGWFKDKVGNVHFNTQNATMPAGNLDIYFFYLPISYSLNFYVGTTNYKSSSMYFQDTITLPISPTKTGFNFDYWCTDEALNEKLNFTTMPSHNVSLYAKFKEKTTLTIDETVQRYTLAQKGTFKLNSKIENFTVQYLVNNSWTTNAPTKKGTYDVKVSRNEDSVYKYFETTIEGGLVITPDNADLSIYSLICYCLASIELIIAIIILFLRKQRKTYLTYAVTLPFGIVSTSGFVNFIVSLTLAIFGFVLIVIELVKLRQVNNEIAKISIENKEYIPPDVSQNSSISKKVEIILEQNGFISADDEDEKNANSDKNIEKTDENETNSPENDDFNNN